MILKRINKTAEDQFLINFKAQNPNGTWDEFRNHEQGILYKRLKQHICNDQMYLCAYCEIDLDRENEHEIKVEHFKSKSGSLPGGSNWHLEWSNLLAVCLGGTNTSDDFELPANLSCDSYKSHYEDKNKINDKDWTGKILLPLTLPDAHNFFTFEKVTGKLLPNESYCNTISIDGKPAAETLSIVTKTIEVLNLNCSRLNNARRKLLFHFNNCARERNLRKLHNLLLQWNQGEPKFFQTTRDIIIRDDRICQGLLNGTIRY
ncbi:TIGR02646 family protein [Escherichia coli]